MHFRAVKARALHLEKIAAAEAVLLSLGIPCIVADRVVGAVDLMEYLLLARKLGLSHFLHQSGVLFWGIGHVSVLLDEIVVVRHADLHEVVSLGLLQIDNTLERGGGGGAGNRSSGVVAGNSLGDRRSDAILALRVRMWVSRKDSGSGAEQKVKRGYHGDEYAE